MISHNSIFISLPWNLALPRTDQLSRASVGAFHIIHSPAACKTWHACAVGSPQPIIADAIIYTLDIFTTFFWRILPPGETGIHFNFSEQ